MGVCFCRVASQVLLLCACDVTARALVRKPVLGIGERARDDLVRYFWTVIFPPEPSFYTPVPIEGISLSALYVYVHTFYFRGSFIQRRRAQRPRAASWQMLPSRCMYYLLAFACLCAHHELNK